MSDTYRFSIICSTAGAYYSEPLRVKIEQHYTRAAKGGIGYAKAAANYGLSLLPTKLAQEEGFDQIIWTDAVSHEYVEEAGTANFMFVIDGTLVTPPRSEEHTSELQSLMRISYAVFCLKKKRNHKSTQSTTSTDTTIAKL